MTLYELYAVISFTEKDEEINRLYRRLKSECREIGKTVGMFGGRAVFECPDSVDMPEIHDDYYSLRRVTYVTVSIESSSKDF